MDILAVIILLDTAEDGNAMQNEGRPSLQTCASLCKLANSPGLQAGGMFCPATGGVASLRAGASLQACKLASLQVCKLASPQICKLVHGQVYVTNHGTLLSASVFKIIAV